MRRQIFQDENANYSPARGYSILNTRSIAGSSYLQANWYWQNNRAYYYADRHQ